MSQSSANPYRRGFKVEEYIDRGASKEERRARNTALDERGRELIRAALDACEPSQRDDLALVLMEEATVAAGRLHNRETIQSRLGRLAHENWAANKAQASVAKANTLFRDKAV